MYIGKEIQSIDTPALWVDMDLMEKNIDTMARYLTKAGVSWRPHIKGIKIPIVAHKLIDAGAIGIACAKLGEAEVMAASGIKNILIDNQIVGPSKVERLAALQRQAVVMPSVDSLINAKDISEAALKYGVRISILIEVNTGMNRCGVEPGEPVLDLVRQLTNLPGIKLMGAMTWEGGRVAKIQDSIEKEKQCHDAVTKLVSSVKLCREHGFEMPIVSCGGSGTYMISSHIPSVTEIQAGGAVFGSIAYRNWGVNLECALFVSATVISRPSITRAIVDAGRKAMNIEVALPEVRNIEGVRVSSLHAEHGLLEVENPEINLNYGDKINFIVGYGDYTVNLYDNIFAVRNGRVEAVWEIMARGKLT
jgi:D-serine deaminase-like pyridoxal phosphate-dependent protein